MLIRTALGPTNDEDESTSLVRAREFTLRLAR
jgi:hypothetical protein